MRVPSVPRLRSPDGTRTGPLIGPSESTLLVRIYTCMPLYEYVCNNVGTCSIV